MSIYPQMPAPSDFPFECQSEGCHNMINSISHAHYDGGHWYCTSCYIGEGDSDTSTELFQEMSHDHDVILERLDDIAELVEWQQTKEYIVARVLCLLVDTHPTTIEHYQWLLDQIVKALLPKQLYESLPNWQTGKRP